MSEPRFIKVTEYHRGTVYPDGRVSSIDPPRHLRRVLNMAIIRSMSDSSELEGGAVLHLSETPGSVSYLTVTESVDTLFAQIMARD